MNGVFCTTRNAYGAVPEHLGSRITVIITQGIFVTVLKYAAGIFNAVRPLDRFLHMFISIGTRFLSLQALVLL